jgi:hypothetical protein
MSRLVQRKPLGDSYGTSVKIKRLALTTGNIAAPSTSGQWQLLAGTALDLPAVVGDYVDLSYQIMINSAVGTFLDLVAVVGGAIAWAASSRAAVPLVEGLTSLYPLPSTYRTSSMPIDLTVAAGHLDSGVIRWQVAVNANGGGTILASAAYPLKLTARNWGSGVTEL